MKFFVPILASAALANQNELARLIAHRVSHPDFPGHVARRVGSMSEVTSKERVMDLAEVAARLYGEVCMDTYDFLRRNNAAEQILQQIDGLAWTIEAAKYTECATNWADYPTPCHQVVDATSNWCVTELCGEFSSGLNPNKAAAYNVCMDWLPTARLP
eukprot:Blabericola_migrator_1__4108@NODE_224_length_11141_cov_42_071880_g190_i0_p10_GENE_NODE_224_length_11141_cov_42_071880_g190_i0NODE_224_length_11141_cov_42_071880_g190_i0_p10_ORF_typecomplete_len158_score22_86_NODE_224_length_11141_cov_42_071880_g190_i044634936